MTNKSIKTSLKVAGAAIIACAVCGVPLVAPFVIGLFGVGALGIGQWLIGGLVVAAAIIFALRRKSKARGCAASSECGQST